MQLEKLPQARHSVIAIPAHNEAANIAECLAAIALQRDEKGAPIARGSFEVLVFANNCSDDTATVARRSAQASPHLITVFEETLPPGKLNAGWARKRAMDLAATRLAEAAPINGLILTTDADSRVAPTWFSAILREFDKGVDCVAGYIDAIPAEYIALGDAFLSRGRLEDTYLSLIAEINALCDPRLHDPWPNHRVSSGASLAVTVAAYSAIGGLPPRPVGEDSALTSALDRAGFKIRHSMDVCVLTSCRFEGRATGGAADTMRQRHAVPDAPCDEEIEPALQATRRALYKRILRERWLNGPVGREWPSGLAVSPEIVGLFDGKRDESFEDAWKTVSEFSPTLKLGRPLRPSDLPRQITLAKMIVRRLRTPVSRPNISLNDRHRREELNETALPD
jgi:cellulose synthase/poly-beta-1,6-N-acetylglucosamine synthase-like glycosyltransferase